ncbi:MAG: hypothetical protein LBT89_04110 [Planctomycetaceae bacterium]|jgi:hypothetical protein|nr:hypothetical protein [Planctomycetaceae bacterium]
MKTTTNFVNSVLLATAITAGSTFADETKTTTSNTQTAVQQTLVKNDDTTNKEKRTQASLKKEKTREELAEEKRLNELREFVKDKKVEKHLITKRGFKLEDKEGKASLDVEGAVVYLRKKEKLAQQVKKDFLIKEIKDYDRVDTLAETAKIQEERAIIQENTAKIQAERAIIQEKGKRLDEENEKLEQEIRQILVNLPKEAKKEEEKKKTQTEQKQKEVNFSPKD